MFHQGFLILIVCLLLIPGFSQSQIYLQHKAKPNRIKKISTERLYSFQTLDSTYYDCRILDLSDSSEIIILLSQDDTVLLPISDILSLEKNKEIGVFEVTAYLGVVLLAVTPVVWAFEGGEAALGTLEGVGVLAACSVPFLLLKKIGKKKDTRNKWRIRAA